MSPELSFIMRCKMDKYYEGRDSKSESTYKFLTYLLILLGNILRFVCLSLAREQAAFSCITCINVLFRGFLMGHLRRKDSRDVIICIKETLLELR